MDYNVKFSQQALDDLDNIEDNSIVNIVRIIYGGRDLPILFDEMNNEPSE